MAVGTGAGGPSKRKRPPCHSCRAVLLTGGFPRGARLWNPRPVPMALSRMSPYFASC